MAITTATIVKRRIPVTSSDHDTVIGEIVDAVDSAFASHCDRVLLREADRVEYHSGGGHIVGPVRLYPVESVSEVKETVYPNDFDSETALTVLEDYDYDPDNGLFYRLPQPTKWYSGRRNVQIALTGGYVAADGSPTGDQVAMPPDLVEAATLQCVELFRRRSKPGVESHSVAGASAGEGPMKLLPIVKSMLSRYVRRTVV